MTGPLVPGGVTPAVRQQAWEEYEAWAAATGVTVRELATIADLDASNRLYAATWGREDQPPLPVDLLRALWKSGNYTAGAYHGAELVGGAMGFFEAPGLRTLHSHIAAVRPGLIGRGTGRVLKLHQRAWCLERDTTTITWTFDPLVRRNAYFNLVKLGAYPVEYLVNFYGVMHDQINQGTETDRCLMRWDLLDPLVGATARGEVRGARAAAAPLWAAGAAVALGITAAGEPQVNPPRAALADYFGATAAGDRSLLTPAGGTKADAGTAPERGAEAGADARAAASTYLVAVPDDIEALRVTDPALARRWRQALREVLGGLLPTASRIGFDKSGWYIVVTGPEVEGNQP